MRAISLGYGLHMIAFLVILVLGGLIVGARGRLALPGPVSMTIGRTLLAGVGGRLATKTDPKEHGPSNRRRLPPSPAVEAGGDPGWEMRGIERELRRPGTNDAFVGEQCRAGAVGAILPRDDANRLAKL